ncbi:hypothetical protein M0804_005627 [Polistes exclamans]|nr:hypothetical protein M0804_005627 [Polistes exclamans]
MHYPKEGYAQIMSAHEHTDFHLMLTIPKNIHTKNHFHFTLFICRAPIERRQGSTLLIQSEIGHISVDTRYCQTWSPRSPALSAAGYNGKERLREGKTEKDSLIELGENCIEKRPVVSKALFLSKDNDPLYPRV